jgi:hypothetical protein
LQEFGETAATRCAHEGPRRTAEGDLSDCRTLKGGRATMAKKAAKGTKKKTAKKK